MIVVVVFVVQGLPQFAEKKCERQSEAVL